MENGNTNSEFKVLSHFGMVIVIHPFFRRKHIEHVNVNLHL